MLRRKSLSWANWTEHMEASSFRRSGFYDNTSLGKKSIGQMSFSQHVILMSVS
jgi:hypothetical protein